MGTVWMMSVHTNFKISWDLEAVHIHVCVVYLSIWSGVGDFSVSATSQFNPFTHMVISSSDVAAEEARVNLMIHFLPTIFFHIFLVKCIPLLKTRSYG